MWVASGLDESRGLYPLRVEPAVGRLVEKLLPGVITTTTGARYYALHALAWAEAQERELDAAAAAAFVRRCEVVMAAASLAHGFSPGGHDRRVPEAHEDVAARQEVEDVGVARERDVHRGSVATHERGPDADDAARVPRDVDLYRHRLAHRYRVRRHDRRLNPVALDQGADPLVLVGLKQVVLRGCVDLLDHRRPMPREALGEMALREEQGGRG